MPEAPLTPDKRRIEADPEIPPPPRAPYVELGLASCFSFLRGASDAVDLVLTARALGYDAIGIADANSMAGVVRLHTEANALKLRPVIGCRIETVEGLGFLAYPVDRSAYGRLCRLISAGRMATPGGGVAGQGRLRHHPGDAGGAWRGGAAGAGAAGGSGGASSASRAENNVIDPPPLQRRG